MSSQSTDWQRLTRDLHGRSREGRRLAIQELSQMTGRHAVAPLKKLSKDRHWEVRLASSEALGNILRDTRLRCPELIERLSDPVAVVRVQAIEALEGIGSKTALRPLRLALNARSPLVRSYAAAAIGSLGTTSDLDRLERALRDE